MMSQTRLGNSRGGRKTKKPCMNEKERDKMKAEQHKNGDGGREGVKEQKLGVDLEADPKLDEEQKLEEQEHKVDS